MTSLVWPAMRSFQISEPPVSGGLVALATGGDGGGSIRIPAGYTGLLGFKGTYGRISRGPHAYFRPGTVVLGNLARSVRDAARYYDVAAGVDPHDPTTLPSHGQWEAGLGSHDLKGRKVAVIPSIGGVKLEPGVEANLRRAADELIDAAGLVRVDIKLDLPALAGLWMMGNLATLLPEIDDLWPGCIGDMTNEVALGLLMSRALYNLDTASEAERQRLELHDAMAAAFEEVDFVICSTNPGPAFPATNTTSNDVPVMDFVMGNPVARFGFRSVLTAASVAGGAFHKLPRWLVSTGEARLPEAATMGGLTIPANVYGNPSVSIPAGLVDGLPVGMQVMGRHHEDALLFDVALAAERHMPWPLVAPSVTQRVAASVPA